MEKLFYILAFAALLFCILDLDFSLYFRAGTDDSEHEDVLEAIQVEDLGPAIFDKLQIAQDGVLKQGECYQLIQKYAHLFNSAEMDALAHMREYFPILGHEISRNSPTTMMRLGDRTVPITQLFIEYGISRSDFKGYADRLRAVLNS